MRRPKIVRLNQAGVTLVELMVTCSIVAIVSIIMMNFMANWLQQNAQTRGRVELLASAQNALDQIGDDIRLSASADQNNRWRDTYAPSAPTDLQSWQSNASTLILASAVEDTSGNIVFSDAASYTSQKNNFIYFVKSGTLYRRTLAATGVTNNKLKTTCPAANATTSCPADKVLATNITTFSVKYYNADNTEVIPTNARSIELSAVSLQKTVYNKPIQVTYKTRMLFRND
jgi:type II secretory pathway component PulJ